MVRDKLKLEESSEKLANLEIPKYLIGQSQGSWHLDKGAARDAISEIYSPDSIYTFLRTSANPKAVETLPKYVNASRGDFSPDPKIRERTVKDDEDDGHALWFDRNLMQVYHKALDQLAEERIGKKNYASFAMVPFHDEGNYGMPEGLMFLPTIHVIRCPDKEDPLYLTRYFRITAENLNSDMTYDIIRKNEAPCNYKMGEVNTLRNFGIEPLVIEPREWQVDGKQLRQAVDFLVPFSIEYKHRDTRCCTED